MTEAVTFSFMKRQTAGDCSASSADKLIVDNPISADLNAMRPCVLPNLLEAARRNIDRGFPDVALFEIGAQYSHDSDSGQVTVATGIRTGRHQYTRHWSTTQRDVDAWDVKADACAALEAAGAVATCSNR